MLPNEGINITNFDALKSYALETISILNVQHILFPPSTRLRETTKIGFLIRTSLISLLFRRRELLYLNHLLY